MWTHRDCDSLTGNRLAFVIFSWLTYLLTKVTPVLTPLNKSTCYSVLRQLRTIRRSVSRSVLQSLVSSLVISRLDYGNSTFPAFHHISCHGCSQWWTPPLGLSFSRRGSSTSPRSFVSCTGWRLQSGSHSNSQSSCTSVYTGLHLHTLLTSFVRWQMSRLVSDSVPVRLHHW